MTSLATGAAKKLIERHAKQYEPQDPFYEFYTNKNGKKKRRKRPPPPGLTKKEAQLLRKVARRAHYLDKGFSICGLRFGWTAIIGLIPGVGDATDAALNWFLVVKPARDGGELPSWLVRKMVFNNAVSAGVGLVPIAGDIMLAVWKANSRNVNLLEEYFRVLGEEHIAAGMQGLTPAPPPLPGQEPQAHTESSREAPISAARESSEDDEDAPQLKAHPAQPAVQKLVKDHSATNVTA
ncbi:hypothetical protein FA10DRAFT_268337 [Acaromyces ingoldii]|uniref:DUF4112 domain-containing protein n=1 Tax=Acaromyces ingoldii TaxID=215250 RepID=A0A316YGY7_9BASI|nr:hypothetical protein FA10DRAFT_268337 [Acaromyces ingoldii]PWN88114.1 hypothetical protein FA10DRAFT_268337 [Acaromyces ingoldii]